MSFINWGNDAPEQRAQRLRMEMEEWLAIDEALRHRNMTHPIDAQVQVDPVSVSDSTGDGGAASKDWNSQS
jgi:hypothetical protein